MSVEFILDGPGTSLFHTIDTLNRMPEPDDVVYLDAVDYKVERIELYLEDDEYTNPKSGQVAPWAISKQLYKIYLSVVAP